jgi:hypothetical protein
MKIRPVAAELFHADEQVECELDRGTPRLDGDRSSQFAKAPRKEYSC